MDVLALLRFEGAFRRGLEVDDGPPPFGRVTSMGGVPARASLMKSCQIATGRAPPVTFCIGLLSSLPIHTAVTSPPPASALARMCGSRLCISCIFACISFALAIIGPICDSIFN